MRLLTEEADPRNLAGVRIRGTVEHRVHRTGESDRPPGHSRAGTTDLGHGAAVSPTARPSGVVARLLSLCAPERCAAGEAGAAARTRGQASSTTLPAANGGSGSWKNVPTVDG